MNLLGPASVTPCVRKETPSARGEDDHMLGTRRRIAAVYLLLTLEAVAFALPDTEGGRPYTTSLSGEAERPDRGDPDATGSAHINVNPGTRQFCWSVSVESVDLRLV